MDEQTEEFIANLKARIEETDDPSKKRDLEARLHRAELDVEGADSVKARRAPERRTAEAPKEPSANTGEAAFMNNDPESHPGAKNEAAEWQEDMPPARLNDGMHSTEQVFQGFSQTGPIDPDKEREGVVLAEDADIERDDKGNAINASAREESEQAEEKSFEEHEGRKPADKAEAAPDAPKSRKPRAPKTANAGNDTLDDSKNEKAGADAEPGKKAE